MSPDPAVPEDRWYSTDHHWVQADPASSSNQDTPELFRVGLTDFAQDALGEVTLVQFADLGQRVEAGAEMGELEAFKAMTDLYMPIAATVIEVNEQLAENPTVVNDDPYGDGWLCRIRADRRDDLEALLDAAAYGQLIGAS